MSTVLYGMHGTGISSDEKLVRATTEPVDQNAKPEMAPAPPDNIDEIETSETPHAGLINSQLASYWTNGEQHAPSWADQAQVGPSFSRINNSQATAGTAAAREMAGQFGHGSAKYAYALEPVIRDGGEFGQDYFGSDHPGIQPAAGRYMEGLQELDVAAANASRSKLEAGDAAVSGYAEWAGAMSTGAWGG